MRASFAGAAALLVGVLSAGSAQAVVMTIRGPVTAVDVQNATIQVRDETLGRMLVIQLPANAPQMIIRNGQFAALQDVQVGQVLEIRHEEADGRQIVHQIEILQAPAVPLAAAAPVIPSTPIRPIPATPVTPVAPLAPVAPIAPAMPIALAPTRTVVDVDVERWNAFDKLFRGVGNVLFGFLEVPRNIFNTSQEENILAGLTLGTFKGVGYTVVRMGAGAYDTLTFPLPLPAGYRPLIEPEFPWEPSLSSPEYLG